MHAPLGKFLSLDHNASEAVGDHHTEPRKMFDNWTVTLVVHRSYGRFSQPLSLRNQPLYVRHWHRTVPQSYRFKCFMFSGHEAVIHQETCAVSE